MRFLLFVEGHTEKQGVGAFIRRWLGDRLPSKVGVSVVNLRGNRRFAEDIRREVHHHLSGGDAAEIIAAIGLLDLYQAADWPKRQRSVRERYEWAAELYEKRVAHEKFRMFFAVHETEAWLLSDAGIFPREVARRLKPHWVAAPEKVDFSHPPASRLHSCYRFALRRQYRKATDGPNLLARLDPATAYEKCPYLKRMLDEMLAMAGETGL